jgi:hypothetical protein
MIALALLVAATQSCRWSIATACDSRRPLVVQSVAPQELSKPQRDAVAKALHAKRDVCIDLSACALADRAAALALARAGGATRVTIDGAAAERGQETAMMQVIGSTNADYEPGDEYYGTGGNYDKTAFFRIVARQRIDDCTTGVLAAIQHWAQRQQLGVTRVELEPRRLYAAVPLRDARGTLSFSYRITQDRSSFNMLVTYTDRAGRELPLESIQSLQLQYRLDSLANDLDEATQCAH